MIQGQKLYYAGVLILLPFSDSCNFLMLPYTSLALCAFREYKYKAVEYFRMLSSW